MQKGSQESRPAAYCPASSLPVHVHRHPPARFHNLTASSLMSFISFTRAHDLPSHYNGKDEKFRKQD